MVKGFESITSPLTDTDKRVLVPALADLLRWCVGNSLAITNTELRAQLLKKGLHCSDAKLRALVNYIRINGVVERLIATSQGYYVATSGNELADYCDSLREREAAIRAVRQALEGQNTKSLF